MKLNIREEFDRQFSQNSIPSEYAEEIFRIIETWLSSVPNNFTAVQVVLRAFELGESKGSDTG